MAKKITVNEDLNLIKDQDYMVAGMAASEGRALLTRLHEIQDRVNKVTVDLCLPLSSYKFMLEKQYSDTFNVNSWFFSNDLRRNFKNGNISFIPNHLHFAGVRRLDHKVPNIFIGNASMPDENGYLSLSLSNVYEKKMIEKAEITILEINPNFPRTLGDLLVHESEIDYFIDVDYDVPVLPDSPSNEKDKMIGKHIAELIHDGDCIQLGIGGIPNAVADALHDKKDLGVHTEMLTTGFMKLYKSGAVTNKKKTLHNGKMIAAFALGTNEL